MKNTEIKIGSNKSFGIVFFVFFLLIAIYPLINNGELRIWSFVIAIIFLILGLINSKVLTPLNKLWFKFGLLLGKAISPLIMGIIFFLVVTPTALIMRIIGNIKSLAEKGISTLLDALGLEFEGNVKMDTPKW